MLVKRPLMSEASTQWCRCGKINGGPLCRLERVSTLADRPPAEPRTVSTCASFVHVNVHEQNRGPMGTVPTSFTLPVCRKGSGVGPSTLSHTAVWSYGRRKALSTGTSWSNKPFLDAPSPVSHWVKRPWLGSGRPGRNWLSHLNAASV